MDGRDRQHAAFRLRESALAQPKEATTTGVRTACGCRLKTKRETRKPPLSSHSTAPGSDPAILHAVLDLEFRQPHPRDRVPTQGFLLGDVVGLLEGGFDGIVVTE